MNWTLWWIFVSVEFFGSLSPGPAGLLVISTALREGWRRSAFSSLGILAANAVYFVLSGTSVGALLAASHTLFLVAKWVGVVYLAYLGLSAMFGRHSVFAAKESARESRPARLFAQAFLLQASNPKAILFFVTLMPQFLDPRYGTAWQIAVYTLTSVSIEFVVLLGYGVGAHRASRLSRDPVYAAWTDRVAGAVLLIAASLIAFAL